MNEKIVDEWLVSIKSHVKARTFSRYREIVFTHILPFLQTKNLSDFSAEDWEDYLRSLSVNGNKRTGKKLSDNSVSQIIGVIKRMHKFFQKCGYIKANNTVELSVHIKQKQIKVLSEYEQRKIERYILKRHSLRDYGFLISLYTGLRIGELLALQWSDIDLKQHRIYVRKTLSPTIVSTGENPYIGTPKTECGARTVPFPKSLLPLFTELKKQNHDYVIASRSGGFVMISSYQRSFASLLNKLNIAHMGVHSLRHTFATRAIERGADMKTLSEILGHSNPTITMNRYVHSSDKQKEKLIERVGGLLKVTM